MKKLMFILLLLIPAFIINAQNKTLPYMSLEDALVQTSPTEELASVQIIDHLYDKTEQAISTLAKALEVPAEHVYNVLVRQQVIKAVSSLIVLIGIIIASIIIISIGYKVWNDKNKNWMNSDKYNEERYGSDYKRYDFDDGWWCILISGGYAFLGICIIVLICMVGDIFSGILNPEYGAIKDIMSIL